MVKATLEPGLVALVDFGTTVGREQAGTRPGVVISCADYHDVMTDVALMVPCTRRDRGWINHVMLDGPTGISVTTFAITEQTRAIDVQRILRVTGSVSQDNLREIAMWVRQWIYAAA